MSRSWTARGRAADVCVTVAVFVGLLACHPPRAAYAQEPVGFSTSFSSGWSQLSTEKGGTVLDDTDAWYLDTDFGWRLGPYSPLWLGFGFAGSYYSEDHDFVSGAFGQIETEVAADISLFAIEPRLRYVIQTGDGGPGLYIAPRIGAGLLITDYVATVVQEFPAGGIGIDGSSDTDFSFEVRPALEVGFSGGPWVLGAEVSYMWAWVDEDAVGDTLEEMRAGVFFRLAN